MCRKHSQTYLGKESFLGVVIKCFIRFSVEIRQTKKKVLVLYLALFLIVLLLFCIIDSV